MAIIQGNAKQGSVRGFYPKVINGSLRFNDDDSAYLSWTPASVGDAQKWTFSAWVKLSDLSQSMNIFGAGTVSTPGGDEIRLAYQSNKFRLNGDNTSGLSIVPSAVHRDPSAWYHIVVCWNTADGTPANRVKLYINGEQVTDLVSPVYPTQYKEYAINQAKQHKIGQRPRDATEHVDGYLANVHFIDGQALTPSDFGETKNGVWVAKDYAGTFGTNGFRLSFADDAEVEAFNTVLYRGNGGTQSITGMGFQPDLVWIKCRSNSYHSMLTDSVRGVGNRLSSSQTAAEATDANAVDSFDSDGFTVDSGSSINANNETFVAWGWKAGDSNVSNTDGSITSTVRANTTYGFSIVSYDGNSTAGATVGHGLGDTPDFMIVRGRSGSTFNWGVYHASLGNTSRIYLNLTNANSPASSLWNSTSPTSSVVTLGSSGDANGPYDYVLYCWAEKSGYSKFGSYTGNGSTDGPEITLGFKPAMVLIKRSSSTGSWGIFDNTRDVDGTINTGLYPNLSNAESTATDELQFTDTGFKCISTGSISNDNGATHIYAAFADTREAAFWLDQSGNDNDWQPVNLDHNDTVADSPTDNFCTLNPLAKGPNNTLSDGNLQVVHGGTSGWQQCQSNFAFPESGKWYCEFTIVYQGDATDRVGINVSKVGYGPINTSTNLSGGNNANIWTYFAHTGSFYNNGSSSGSASTFGTGDVIQVSFDSDTGSLYFGKNGVWQNSGDPVAGTGYAYTGLSDVAVGTEGYSNAKVLANFGQQPFKYDPPA